MVSVFVASKLSYGAATKPIPTEADLVAAKAVPRGVDLKVDETESAAVINPAVRRQHPCGCLSFRSNSPVVPPEPDRNETASPYWRQWFRR